MTYTREIIGIEDFANCCDFCLRGNVLTASCHLRDATGQVHKLERTVDLTPAIDLVSRNLAAWHAQQHGQDATVSGWGDIVSKAVATVKKVAQNKTVHSLYEQAKPFLKDAVKKLPGGKNGMDLANKAAKVYSEAKQGSKAALAKVRQVQALAAQGDAEAKYVVKVMQNVGTIIRQKAAGLSGLLPEVAHAVQAQRAVRDHRSGTSYYHLGVTSVSGVGDETPTEYNDTWNPHYDIVGWNPFVRRRKAKRPHQVMDHRARPASQKQVNKNWGGRKADMAHADAQMVQHDSDHSSVVPPITPDLAAEMMPPPLGASAAPTTPDLPTPGYDPYGGQDPGGGQESAYVDDSYYDGGSEDGPYEEQENPVDQEVSGWMYNRPYRSLSQHFLQSQKSPGVAAAARELYNRGLGRPDTTLSQLALEALHQLG